MLSNKEIVYIAIPKSDFEELKELLKENYKALDIITQGIREYKDRNLKKRWSSIKANEKKQKMAFQKCAIALYYMQKNLFSDNKPVTPYRLKKEANVHFNTAKKFLEKYEWEIERGRIEDILKELNVKSDFL